MFHKVMVIGHLGGEPTTNMTQTGQNVCSFNIATTRKWTNADGSPGAETVWFRVSAWGRLGEICQQYLQKGKQVFIEGELVPDRESGHPRIWTDQNGAARASFELRALTMKMLGSRDDAGGNYAGNDYENQAPAQQQRSAPANNRPAQQQARPAQQQQAQSNRRSTMSAPQAPANDDYGDFGPEDIPF